MIDFLLVMGILIGAQWLMVTLFTLFDALDEFDSAIKTRKELLRLYIPLVWVVWYAIKVIRYYRSLG